MKYFTLFLLMIVSCVAAEHPELKAYPKAEKGFERFVIVLPKMADEMNYKVEIVPGRKALVDTVNKARVGYSIKSEVVKGWGYTKYKVQGKGMIMSTLMAPLPGSKKVEKFVSGQGQLVRYNSKLPIVVYGPIGSEIRYRIWSASGFKEVEK
ncbi:MAG: ecotin family protein [Lentisphaeraceae bacterium]|nr:ecotin family protein [Lentisphaeraceae bacterium]